jgi:uncharacterized protein
VGAVTEVGTVSALFRYPVKSTAGERLDTAELDERGLVLDRTWAVRTADGGIGSGKTSRRFRRLDGLLGWRSGVGDGGVWLAAPEGPAVAVDDPQAEAALSRAYGRPLVLRPEAEVPHHDDCGVHLVTTSSLRRAGSLTGGPVDPRRLRPNLVLDTADEGFVEDGWVGAELALGEQVVLRLGEPMPRCVMVDADHRDVATGPRLLKTLGRAHGTFLGLMAEVRRPGTVRVGDDVVLHA